MAKRANYGFVKRQKELKRQQKKDAKAEKKRMKKEAAAGEQRADVDAGDGGVGSADGLPSDPVRNGGDGG